MYTIYVETFILLRSTVPAPVPILGEGYVILTWDSEMNSNPSACKQDDKTAPNDIPDGLVVLEILAAFKCA